jgi:RimJ/RimL family protein N-acetyltransferase
MAWRDPEMHRWMPEEEEPFDDDRAGEFVAAASRLLSEGTMLAMAVSDESSGGEVAGSLIFNIWTAHHWNVGNWIAAAYRGHGLATQAVSAATRWAFEDRPELSRISLYTVPGNLASQRVAARAGFHREGTLRKWAYVRGRELDWTMFSLLREDLPASPLSEGKPA